MSYAEPRKVTVTNGLVTEVTGTGDVSMQWVEEYKYTLADDTGVDATSDYTNADGIDVTTSPTKLNSGTITSSGLPGVLSSNTTASIILPIADMIAKGGGPAFDPNTDAYMLIFEYAGTPALADGDNSGVGSVIVPFSGGQALNWGSYKSGGTAQHLVQTVSPGDGNQQNLEASPATGAHFECFAVNGREIFMSLESTAPTSPDDMTRNTGTNTDYLSLPPAYDDSGDVLYTNPSCQVRWQRQTSGTTSRTLVSITVLRRRAATYTAPTLAKFNPSDAASTTDPNSLLDSVTYNSATGEWTVSVLENTAGGDLSDIANAITWRFPLRDKNGNRMRLDSYLFRPVMVLEVTSSNTANTKLGAEMHISYSGDTIHSGGGLYADNATGLALTARTSATTAANAGDANVVVASITPEVNIGRWGNAEVAGLDASGVWQADVTRALTNGTGADQNLDLVITVAPNANNTGTQTIKFIPRLLEFFAVPLSSVT